MVRAVRPCAEEALFEMSIYREFVGLSGTNRIPDRVSFMRFGKTPSPRHLLEEHDLSPRILQIINDKLSAQGLLLKAGTVVDATLIAAPSSTKNKDGERDPQMHQVKKGNQWHFGMKAHIGVDADSGLVPGLPRRRQTQDPCVSRMHSSRCDLSGLASLPVGGLLRTRVELIWLLAAHHSPWHSTVRVGCRHCDAPMPARISLELLRYQYPGDIHRRAAGC